MFTFTNNLILMSTSNNSNSFISNSNFTLITILLNQLLFMSATTILLTFATILATLFFYFCQHFCNHVPTQFSNHFQFSFLFLATLSQPCQQATHLTHSFSQPVFHQQFFLQLSSIFNWFIALFPSPPCFFLDQMCCLPTAHLGGELCRGSVVLSSRYCIRDIRHLLYIRSLLV